MQTLTSRLAPLNHIQRLSEEILLEILSYLSIKELLAASTISKRFNRLCDEPQLWRRIYHALFAIERLKHPFSPAKDQRLRGSIESRAFGPQPVDRKGKKKQRDGDQWTENQLDLGHTWKTLCRVSLNWKTGSAGLTRITPTHLQTAPKLIPTSSSATLATSTTPDQSTQDSSHQLRTNTIVRFYRSLLFITCKTSISSTDSLPVVHVYRLENHSTDRQRNRSVLVGKLVPSFLSTEDFESSIGQGVTEISIDESSSVHPDSIQEGTVKDSALLLSVFYTHGWFIIFKINLPIENSPDQPKLLNFPQVGSFQSLIPPTAWTKKNNAHAREFVETAKFHYPLIVTCSVDFHIKFYQLLKSKSQDQFDIIKLCVDMQNQSCYWPLSLSLRPSTETEKFQLKIAYPMPFYPSAWTIGLQEFEFEIIPPPNPSLPPSLRMHTNRFVTAFQYSQNKSCQSMNAIEMGEWIIGIEQSAENVIVGRSDNTIDFLRLSNNELTADDDVTRPNAPAKQMLLDKNKRLICWKRLFGHTSRIGSISIDESGRCVSAAMDGIKVWDGSEPVDIRLNLNTNVKQANLSECSIGNNLQEDVSWYSTQVSWIGLDNEKIVSLCIPSHLDPKHPNPNHQDQNIIPYPERIGGLRNSLNPNEEVRILSFI